MNVKIEPSWHQRLQAEFEQPYFAQLVDFVRHEYSTQTCYPPAKLIFNAFNLCPFTDVKVGIKFFRCRWCGSAAVATEHLQGDTTRFRHAYTSFRRPFALGSSRSIIAQRHPYSTCPPGCIAPATRLGAVYRCRHTCLVGRTRPYCVYTLGRIRTQQSCIDRPYKAPYTRVGSSLTAVCQSWWMVWQPPFLALQPMACRTWRKAYRVVEGLRQAPLTR